MHVQTLVVGFGIILCAVLNGCGNGMTSQSSQTSTGNATQSRMRAVQDLSWSRVWF